MRSGLLKTTALWFGLAGVLHAQVLDLQTGREANLEDAARFSIEGGLVAGDIDYVGVRGNWLAKDRLLIGVNLGMADLADNESALGGFAMYQFNREEPVHVALKAGFDMVISGDEDIFDASLLAVVSRPINDKVAWYANGGVHYVKIEVDSVDLGRIGIPVGRARVRINAEDDDIAPVIGGGFIFRFNNQAEAFAAVDILLGDLYDDAVFGGGFRWAFR